MSLRLPCSYLRLYEPQASISESRLIDLQERVEVVNNLDGAVGLITPNENAEAFRIEHRGEIYWCDAMPAIRVALSAVAMREGLDGAEFMIGDDVLAEAQRRLARWSSETHPNILQTPWHVPLSWFVGFASSDRVLEEGDEGVNIRYVSKLDKAIERLDKARELIAGRGPEAIAQILAAYREWIDGAEPEGVIELDYAGVSELFDPDALADDCTAKDIWSAISDLADGNPIGAAFHYTRAEERWIAVRDLAERS